jgi:hypothetical protein
MRRFIAVLLLLASLNMTIQCFKDVQEECDMHLIDARAYLQKHVRHEVERPLRQQFNAVDRKEAHVL